jgi:hypothetical protein
MNHDVLSLRHGHDFSLPALVLQQLIWATIEEIEDLEIVDVLGGVAAAIFREPTTGEFSFEAST